MARGEVVEYVTYMQTQIRLQREGDKVVAMLPAYQLPFGMVVEADSTDEAIEALMVKVRKYWHRTEE